MQMTRPSSRTVAFGSAISGKTAARTLALIIAGFMLGAVTHPQLAKALAPADAPEPPDPNPAVVTAEAAGELDLRLGREAAAKIAGEIEPASRMPVFLEPDGGAFSYRPRPPSFGISPQVVIDPDQSPAEPAAGPLEGDTLANALDGIDVQSVMIRLSTPFPF